MFTFRWKNVEKYYLKKFMKTSKILLLNFFLKGLSLKKIKALPQLNPA